MKMKMYEMHHHLTEMMKDKVMDYEKKEKMIMIVK